MSPLPAINAAPFGKEKIQRRLAAILTADIVGYSALMGSAEEDTHRRVCAEISKLGRAIARSGGQVFGVAGDGLIAEFPSAVDAVTCALRFQTNARRRTGAVSPERRLLFRIGIHAGEIMVQGDQIGGTAVNIAARLEPLADPGGILISAAVYDQVRQRVPSAFACVGERRLKNIRAPVMLYATHAKTVLTESDVPTPPRSWDRVSGEERRDYRPVLAVLPFRALHRSEVDTYFAEGMIDDIIRALSGLKDLLVISRSSTAGFKLFPVDLHRAFRELDADYVLHGSLRRQGDALRLTVELANHGGVIWADRFDGTLGSIFEMQDAIAMRVASIVAPHLRSHELARADRKRPESLTAYDLTLQALSLIHKLERTSFIEARRLLEQAAACDAAYAPAYSHLASLGMQWIGQGWSNDDNADCLAASHAARMAIERDPNDAVGLSIYGHLQSYLLHDYYSAQEYFKRALAAGPSCASAWAYSGLTLGYAGETARAVEHAEHAVRLSPLGSDAFWLEHYLSQAYYLAGRHEDAIAWGRASAAKGASNASNLRCLIASLVAAGQRAEADLVARQLLKLIPEYRVRLFRSRTPLCGQVRDIFATQLLEAGIPD
ncbi:hypothetical protein MKK65_17870 [Methylobacterium sp. J-001]|uniref:adenylate/guanylate cyclase domain-containing protein n=1 Tax=unclassified Methylobacterium TaxID=2615210 RepID=UPI001FBA82F4|nr:MULTISPECIES: adenylate/guanylate cyclase domain-containing protein [unclassified Methylobacterium]MCJ2096681.1 hypothetical protein [Methylobacterium sp. J-072]MCJ2118413.1 hypothetical protein [Methylobacterium sp. J-001]